MENRILALGFIISLSLGMTTVWAENNGELSASNTIVRDSILNLIELEVDDSVKMQYYNQLRRLTTFDRPDEALIYNAKFGELANKLSFEPLYGMSKAYDATLYIPIGRYEEALQSLLEAERIFDRLGNQAALGSIYNSMGAVYERTNRDSLARIYYQRSFNIAQERGDLARQSIALTNISELYFRGGDFEKSMQMMEEVLQSDELLHADYLPRYQLIYANSLLAMEKNSSAREIYEEILLGGEELNAFIRASSLLGLGKFSNKEQNFSTAKNYLKSAKEIAIAQGFKEIERDAYSELIVSYQNTGDYQNAFTALLDFSAIKDSLESVEKDRNLINALTRFEADKKEQEIQLLNTQNEVKDLQIQKANRDRVIFMIGLIALGVLAFFAFRLQRIKTKNNQILREKNVLISKTLEEKNILLKEIHHRVKNNLQVISSLLKLQSQYIDDQKAVMAIAEGRNRVNSMAILHQNLYRDDDVRGVNMEDYFVNLIQGLFDAYNIEDERIKLKTRINPLTLDIDTVIPLGLIANELVSNALKHAFEDIADATLEVELWEEDKSLFFKVKDNGIGLSKSVDANKKGGFGQKLINSLAAKLEAEIQVVRVNGTEVVLRINEYQKVA
ncbi:MAG: hypothetical protein EA362_00925 [Saprospirales bacterium]|nr:MAG: hypothetical protein EA362_00925 [Saprospirales bacterium]